MVKIPEYTAQEGIQINPKSMPDTTYTTRAANALTDVGSQLSSFGEHLTARFQQKEDTDAALAYETASADAKLSSQEAIDNNEASDGEGMTSAAMTAIDAKAAPILKSLPARLQKEYEVKFGNLKKQHQLVVADEQNKKRYEHYGKEADRVIGNKSMDVVANPTTEQFNKAKAENDKLIDGMPITAAQKEILHDRSDTALAEAKAQGVLKKDPNQLKKDLGAGGKSTSGANVPGGKVAASQRGRQLAFVWHEMTGEAGSQHGGGSEAKAFRHLKSATTLADALEAGFDYERPAVRNRAARFAKAKSVLAGTASAEAMQARAYFESKGLTPVQASGLVGALMGESGDHLHPGSHNPQDAGGGSWGVGQWNNQGAPRRTNMENFTGDPKMDSGPGAEVGAGLSAPGPGAAVVTTGELGVLQGGATDPAYEHLSVERRLQLVTQADSELKRREAESYVGAASRVSQLGDDALTTYKMHGAIAGIQEPTLTDFVQAAKGDIEAGGKAHQSFQNAKQAAILEHSFQNMTPDEIVAAVAAAKERIPIGPGAAEAAKMYDAVQAEGLAIAKEKALSSEEKVKLKERIAQNWIATHAEAEKKRKDAQDIIDKAAADAQEARQGNSYKWATNSSETVKNAWNTAAAAPNQPALTAAAIDATYKAQKNVSIYTHNMELIPPEVAQNAVKYIMSDLEDVSSEQKMENLMQIMHMTENPLYQRIIFDQLKRAGLPAGMKFAVMAGMRGDTGSYSLLFNPALAKNIPGGDSKATKELKDKAEEFVSGPLGQSMFGSGQVDANSIDDTNAAIQLLTNTAKLIGGDPTDAIKRAGEAIVGPQNLVESRLNTGTQVQVTVPKNTDPEVARKGFDALQGEVKDMLKAREDPMDPTVPIKVDQVHSMGQWRNYGSGYAFKLLGGGYLPDPTTGEVKEWSYQEIKRAAARPVDQKAARIRTRYGQQIEQYTGPGEEVDMEPGLGQSTTLEPPPYTRSLLKPEEPRRNQF